MTHTISGKNVGQFLEI